MAKIIRDALVLSESESQILKANLLHPTVNQARDEYLRSLENLVVSVSDSSFSVSIPDLVLPEFDEPSVFSTPKANNENGYLHSITSISFSFAYQNHTHYFFGDSIASSQVHRNPEVTNHYSDPSSYSLAS